MTERLYFTCPIKALYMMKEFGVGFILEDEEKLRSFLGVGLSEEKETFEEKLRIKSKYFIAKESEHIFEPKKGDEGRWVRPIGAHYANHNGEQWVSAGIEPNPPKIIMRDNKQFFMPEVENE